MNMCNQPHTLGWKPLHFQELARMELSPLASQSELEDLQKNKQQSEQEEDKISINTDDPKIALELENIKQQAREQAYQEGFNQGKEEGFNIGKQAGYEQGLAIGKQEGLEKIEQQLNEEKLNSANSIKKLANSFMQSVNQINETVTPKLFDLALLAAEKTVGSLPNVKQKQLMHTIKAVIEQTLIVDPPMTIRLNPNDFVWLEPLLNDEIERNEWQFIADASIELGGCKIFTQTNEIDASVNNHWQIISDSVHGDES